VRRRGSGSRVEAWFTFAVMLGLLGYAISYLIGVVHALSHPAFYWPGRTLP
jgi:hypothetical protein